MGGGPPAPLPPVEEEEDGGSPTKKKAKRKKKEEPEEEEYHQSADPATGLPQVQRTWYGTRTWHIIFGEHSQCCGFRLFWIELGPGNPLSIECPSPLSPLFHVYPPFVGTLQILT